MPVLTKINTNVIADDAVTAAKIPAGAVTASETAAGSVTGSDIGYLGDGSGNLSGTIANQQLHFGSAFTLTDNLTVNDNLTLGKVRDDGTGQSLTGDGKTITGTGTLTMGSSLEGGQPGRDDKTISVNGMTGTLGSDVTGGSGLTALGTVTAGNLSNSAIVYPALHGIVGKSGCNVYPASPTVCTASAETKILFATEAEDIAGEFASNKFTVTVAGRYYIMVQITLQDFEDGKAMQAKIMKNGSQIAFDRVNNGRVDHATSNVSTMVTLAASDYIEGYTWHNNSVYRNSTSGANADTFMVIMRLT